MSEQSSEKTSKKRKRFSKRRIIGLTLVLAGVAVLLYIPVTWVVGYFVQRDLRGQYDQESAASLALDHSVLDKLQGAADRDKLRQLAIAFKSRLSEKQTIAKLEIPKIGLNVIVVEGSSDSALHKGPGHLESTPLPGMNGNFAVAGDRVLYGGPFLRLNDLAKGDEIIVHTPYGNFNYSVTDQHITQPEDTSVLNSDGQDEITLITCDPIWDTTHRLIIHGKLTSSSLRQGET
ncbi:MAG: sortase [Thermoleophilia bacterium]